MGIQGGQQQTVRSEDGTRIGFESEGRFGDALSIVLVEEVGMPKAEVAAFRTTPQWKEQLVLAPPSVVEWEDLVAAEVSSFLSASSW